MPEKGDFAPPAAGAPGDEALWSVFSVAHSVSVDGKHGFSLGQARRVVNLADSGFTEAFSQIQSVRGEGNTTGRLIAVIIIKK